jgi:hypothetical protein
LDGKTPFDHPSAQLHPENVPPVLTRQLTAQNAALLAVHCGFTSAALAQAVACAANTRELPVVWQATFSV